MVTLTKDRQSRIVRYGLNCFHILNGIKCHAYAHANKKGNTLVISDAFEGCIDANGQSVVGIYKIVNVGTGKIANVICEKL